MTQYITKTISITLLLVVGFLFSCKSQDSNQNDTTAKNITINGEATQVSSGKIYLEKVNERNIAEKVDSAEIANNKFTFKKQLEEPGIYQLNIDNNQIVGFILEGDEDISIKIEENLPTGEPNFKITGSERTDLFNSIVEEQKKFMEYRREAEEKFKTASKKEQATLKQAYAAKEESLRNRIKPTITKLGTSLAGIIAANNFLNQDLDKDFISALAEKVKAENIDHYYAKIFLKQATKTTFDGNEGSPAPDFTLKTLAGKTVTLSELKGKTVIIDFWATWCGPCIMSFPGMKKAQEKFADRDDVVFLYIDTFERVSPEQWESNTKNFLERKNLNFFDPVIDKENSVAQEFGVNGIPAKFCIDKEGNIKHKSVGYLGSTEAVYKEMVKWVEE